MVTPELGSMVYLIVRKRARVTDSEWFSFVRESIVTENNFCRCYHEWGKTVFPTREDAERRLTEIDG